MRISYAATVFGLAVLVVACGGGGKSGVLPAGGQQPGLTQPTPGKVVEGSLKVVLKIPPASQQSHARKPFFISPNTQSVAIAVLQNPAVGETPNPATAQIFPVTTPSPCATSGSGGETCTFDVQAPFGEDVFYVATFSVANPTASSIPLSDFESGAIAVASPGVGPTPSPLAFVMNGVVNSVVLTVPSPDPGNTPNTQVFTAGVPSSAQTLGITPYDASGAPILTDAFDGPITVSVTPANAGVGLAINATCPGASATIPGAAKRRAFSGNPSIEILCASDLTNVTFGYSGAVTPDANGHITDTFAINASQIASPAPANVVLASNMLSTTLNPATDVYTALAQTLPSGQVVYMADLNDTWYIGTYDPSTGIVNQGVANGVNDPLEFTVAPNGVVWVNDSGPIDCFPSVAAAISGTAENTLGLYPQGPASVGNDLLWPTSLVADSANNIWYTAWDEIDSTQTPPAGFAGYFPTASTGCAAPSVNPPVAQYLLGNDIEDESPSMALLPGGNGVAVISSSIYSTPVGVYQMTNTTPSGTISAVPGIITGGLGTGVAVDGAGNAYAMFSSNVNPASDIEKIASGASSASTLLSLPATPAAGFPQPEPSGLSEFSQSGAAASSLAYTDTDFEALGLVENLSTSPIAEVESLPNGAYAYATMYGALDEPMILDMDSSENLNVVSALATTTWSVANVALNPMCGSNALLSILERGDSGPFTVNLPAASGVTAAALPGADHDFWLTVPTVTTSFTASVTDAHGRTEQFNVTSTPSYVTCGAARRHPGQPALRKKPRA